MLCPMPSVSGPSWFTMGRLNCYSVCSYMLCSDLSDSPTLLSLWPRLSISFCTYCYGCTSIHGQWMGISGTQYNNM